MATRMMRWMLALGLFIPLAASALQDPTAPPGATAASGEVDGQAIPLTAIKMQGNKRIAIIGGQSVAVGESYRNARVVRISDHEVVLRRGKETTVLKLYPQVEKRLRGQ